MPLISKKSISKFEKNVIKEENFDPIEEITRSWAEQITKEINKKIIDKLIKKNCYNNIIWR